MYYDIIDIVHINKNIVIGDFKMKVIFLDIDGVLNHMAFVIKKNANTINEPPLEGFPQFQLNAIDSKSLSLVKKIVDKTDSKIVISSTWRINKSKDDFIRLFDRFGFPNAPVIDCTPVTPDRTRGIEIDMWLMNNSCVSNFIILDDDSDMTDFQIENNHFIKINYETGITGEDVKTAIKHLNRR
jgi:hypothetical protein